MASPTLVPSLKTPNGFEEIKETFGDISTYIEPDGTLSSEWEAKFIETAILPFTMKLSWDHSKTVSRIRCHKRLVPIFGQVFGAIQQQGLAALVPDYGGCYVYRPKRTSTRLSTHSWGIAIDINPNTNPQGKPGNMDARIIRIFEGFGFYWGGRFSGKSKDPMHFQYCKGY